MKCVICHFNIVYDLEPVCLDCVSDEDLGPGYD